MSGTTTTRLKMALQKSGRLSDRSRELLARAGIDCEWRTGRLDCRCVDFPLDIMLVRDDDIPRYVADGVCDLGIVGSNMLAERLGGDDGNGRVEVLRRLGFGHCRLSVAAPETSGIRSAADLDGRRIATSYPETTRAFCARLGIKASIVEIGGSVEVAPAMGVADVICDLVSTGATLQAHGLTEISPVLASEAVLVRSPRVLGEPREEALARLLVRLSGALRAERAKYIMMNAPAAAVEAIRRIIPGLEEPTVMPLSGDRHRVAVHAVAPEPIFWETMEKLKAAGASSILVVPIEKIIE